MMLAAAWRSSYSIPAWSTAVSQSLASLATRIVRWGRPDAR